MLIYIYIKIYHLYFYNHSFYHCLLYGLYIGLDSEFLNILAILEIFLLLIHYAIEFRFFVSRNVEVASSLSIENLINLTLIKCHRRH